MIFGNGWCRRMLRGGAILAVAVLALAGCLQTETVVTVNRDGSGTIVDRLVLSSDTVAMLAEFQPEGETFQVFDEAELREGATKYGQAVRFVSAHEVETDFGQGFEANYAFDDVNEVRIVPNPGDKIPGDAVEAEPEAEEEEPVTFTLQRADPTELVIGWPLKEADPSDAPEAAGEAPEMGQPEPEEVEMMKAMFQDLRMAMHVEVAGEIVETNATHRDGARVTLVDLSFADLLSDDAGLMAFMQEEPETLDDLKRLMQQIPGMKLEVERKVVIRFQ